VNQFVAIWRRVSAASAIVAIVATVALLSGSMPAPARAQADQKPAEPAPSASDTAAVPGKPAESTTKSAKPAKTPKPAKPAKTKAAEPSLEEQRAIDGAYTKQSNWLSFRFGYAKRSGDLNGDGFVGYGVGYTHMMTRKYAFAAGVGHDVVGHFGSQLDVAVPFTVEFQRHYKWSSTLRPFIGIGGGYYFRKFYRTGTDYNTTTTGGPHLSVGFTSALDARHVIGFETRVARIQGRPGILNSTFGPGEANETIWTVKLSWALVY
jgi:hypothetical protein